jgi:hypothetical protein
LSRRKGRLKATAVLVYVVLVVLLTTWPWNVWLATFGAWCAYGLDWQDSFRGFGGPNARDLSVGNAQRIHESFVSGDKLNAAHELARVLGDKQFSNLSSDSGVDTPSAGEQRGRDGSQPNGSGVLIVDASESGGARPSGEAYFRKLARRS